MAQDWEWFSHIGGDDWGMVYDCFTHMIGHFKRAYCQDIFHRSVKSQKSQHTLPHPGLQTIAPSWDLASPLFAAAWGTGARDFGLLKHQVYSIFLIPITTGF